MLYWFTHKSPMAMSFFNFGNKYLQLCGEKQEGITKSRLKTSYTLHRIQQTGMEKYHRGWWEEMLRYTSGT
jgi:hypothetical protein